MAKVTLKLSNGTTVTIEGAHDEVKALLDFYGGVEASPLSKEVKGASKQIKRKARKAQAKPDLSEIVNLVKDCDEAEAIEEHILDRTGQVDRTLLPLYIVHEYLDNAFGLTSGEIYKITRDLGIPISQPNASRTLSGTASKYVIGDKVKARGKAVRYKLSRRGVKYLKQVLKDGGDGQ